MLRAIVFTLSFIFCFPVYAKEYKLFVSNEHTKPITIEKETGQRITILANERITSTFQSGTTIKNYVDGKNVCDWYLSNNHKLLGLVYGWFGNHPSHLGCGVLMKN